MASYIDQLLESQRDFDEENTIGVFSVVKYIGDNRENLVKGQLYLVVTDILLGLPYYEGFHLWDPNWLDGRGPNFGKSFSDVWKETSVDEYGNVNVRPIMVDSKEALTLKQSKFLGVKVERNDFIKIADSGHNVRLNVEDIHYKFGDTSNYGYLNENSDGWRVYEQAVTELDKLRKQLELQNKKDIERARKGDERSKPTREKMYNPYGRKAKKNNPKTKLGRYEKGIDKKYSWLLRNNDDPMDTGEGKRKKKSKKKQSKKKSKKKPSKKKQSKKKGGRRTKRIKRRRTKRKRTKRTKRRKR